MPKSTFRNLVVDMKQGLLTASDEGNNVIIEFFFNNLRIRVQGANNVRYSTRSGRQCRPNRKFPVADMLARWQQRKEAEMENDTGPTEADDDN